MDLIKHFIELFFPFLKVNLGRIFIVPPILGYALLGFTNLLSLKRCGFISKLVSKRKAGLKTCEEQDIYILDQATDIINDPLTTVECIEKTLTAINTKYKLDLLVNEFRVETIVNIGDWDMNVNKTISVAHLLTDITKLVSISIVIRNDSSVQTHGYFFTEIDGIWAATDATNVDLDITGLTDFDDPLYNATSFNRGYITFIVKP